jgi:hypothetical protein
VGKERKTRGKRRKKIDDLQSDGRFANTDWEVEDEGDFADKYTWPKLRAIDEGFTEVGVRSAYGGDCEQWML